METPDREIAKSAEDARQGVTLNVMRYVLGFGLGGAAVALLVVVLFGM